MYLLWFSYYPTIPKTHRFTLGQRIDGLLIEIIEATSVAGFSAPADKLPYLRIAMRKLDTVKVLLLVLFETHSFDDKRYVGLSQKLEEVGRMLGGWHGQAVKQNSSDKASKEKNRTGEGRHEVPIVPVVVEAVDVLEPVIAIPVQIPDVAIAIGGATSRDHGLQEHHPSTTLGVESDARYIID